MTVIQLFPTTDLRFVYCNSPQIDILEAFQTAYLHYITFPKQSALNWTRPSIQPFQATLPGDRSALVKMTVMDRQGKQRWLRWWVMAGSLWISPSVSTNNMNCGGPAYKSGIWERMSAGSGFFCTASKNERHDYCLWNMTRERGYIALYDPVLLLQ